MIDSRALGNTADETYDPMKVDVVGLANALEFYLRPYTCADGTRSTEIRMGDAQASVVAEALHALATTFDQAERLILPGAAKGDVKFCLGEQGYLAAVAALRALSDRPQPRPPGTFDALGLWLAPEPVR